MHDTHLVIYPSQQKHQCGHSHYRERDDALKAAVMASEYSGKKAEDASKKHSKSNAAVKRLEADVSKLTNQIAALEHANRSTP